MIGGATMNFSQKEQSKRRPFEKDKVLLLYPLNLEGVPKISTVFPRIVSAETILF